MTPDSPPTGTQWRPARRADMERLAEIYGQAVLEGLATFEEVAPDATEMARRWQVLRRRRLPYLVAEVDGRVLGYAYAGPYRPRSGYRYTVEDSVYVDPAAQGLGLGAGLLSRVVEICAALGYRQMVAVIGDSANLASIRLHAGQGFEHAGTLTAVGLKLGQWVDCVYMQRPLGPGAATLPDV